MTWVLIAILFYAGRFGEIEFQEFGTKEACEAAGVAMIEVMEYDAHRKHAKWTCVPKGDRPAITWKGRGE